MTSASLKNPSSSSPAKTRGAGWWHHPWMWFILGAPATIVVAGIITAVIATVGMDPVIGNGSLPPVKLNQATENVR